MAKYYFIRHGNAKKARQGQHDMDRTLTKKGVRQANSLREWMPVNEFDLVIRSPARRVVQTTDLILGPERPINIVGIQTMYPWLQNLDETAEMMRLFEELGYTTAQKYLESDRQSVYMKSAQVNTELIMASVNSMSAKKVLVGGHAVMLNFIAYVMGGVGVLHLKIDEACGFVLDESKSFNTFDSN